MDLTLFIMCLLAAALVGMVGTGLLCYGIINRQNRQVLYLVRNLSREQGMSHQAVNACIAVLRSELPLPQLANPISVERMAQNWFSAWYNSYAATELASEKEARDIIAAAKER